MYDDPVSPCQLLTKMARLTRALDEQPAAVLAADDVWFELQRLRASIDKAQETASKRRAEPPSPAGRACPDETRHGSKLTFDLEIVHDDDAEELLALLTTRIRRLLDDDDVDIWSSSTRWAPIGPDAAGKADDGTGLDFGG